MKPVKLISVFFKTQFHLILITILFSACASEDKPYYKLDGAETHNLQSGDSVLFSVSVGESISEYSMALESSTQQKPDDTSINLFLQKSSSSSNISRFFPPLYLSQNESGDIILHAIGNAGDILWLRNAGDNYDGYTLYFSDLNSMPNPYSFTASLQRCNGSDCSAAGEITLNITLVESKKTEAFYADFDAYEILIERSIVISAEDSAQTSNYFLKGNQFIYPPIGLIKFVYERLSKDFETQNQTIVGSLSNTNISIPDSLKNIN